ncbi:MAG: gluconate 2-dehydrogenase subunit 3 family protein [Polyangiaceae bacterium]
MTESTKRPVPHRRNPTPARFGRRAMVRATLGLGAFGVAMATLGFVRTRGYVIDPKDRRRLVALSPWQFVLVQALARRIVASDRPGDPSVPTPDETDVAGFVDAYVANMAAPLRRDLGRCFVYVEHFAPFRSGYSARFTRLPPDAQDAVLAAMEAADEDLLRGGFDGLRALVFMGYYRDARTWSILGYEGPLVPSASGDGT